MMLNLVALHLRQQVNCQVEHSRKEVGYYSMNLIAF